MSKADRANYIGLLVTPVLRSYLRSLIPFGLVSASTASSGKTILTAGVGLLYGQRVLSWTESDAELRKSITSVLAEPVGAVVFDNLHEGTAVQSPVLAQLLTSPTWSGRKLGSNTTLSYANDRLWLATGNNLRVGGDMATRTVLIRLDPKMPNPESRTKFTIKHLDRWILAPSNQRELLWHLLVLVIDWCNAGAPRAKGLVMRQFTPWAEAVGGFLAHHAVDGFLTNVEDVREIDDQDAEWTTFLARWRSIFGEERITANRLRQSADIDNVDGKPIDRWEGSFLTDENGRLPSVKSLGRYLRGQVGRYHGKNALQSVMRKHDSVRLWWVEQYHAEEAPGAGSAELTQQTLQTPQDGV